MNYRVVLADDEPEVLRSIQRTLDWEKYGFSVVGAFLNGLDVLEFLENHARIFTRSLPAASAGRVPAICVIFFLDVRCTWALLPLNFVKEVLLPTA